MDSAKLSLFSKVDAPVPNQQHGLRYFYFGVTDEMALDRRGRLLAVTREDLISASQQYLATQRQAGKTSKIIFGTSTADLKKLESEGWKVERFSEGLSLRKKLYEEPAEDADREHVTM